MEGRDTQECRFLCLSPIPHFHIPSPWTTAPLQSRAEKALLPGHTRPFSWGLQSRKGTYGGTGLKSLVWESGALAAKVSHLEVVSWLVKQQPPSWTCVGHSSLWRHFRHLCATVSSNLPFTRRQKGQRVSPRICRWGTQALERLSDLPEITVPIGGRFGNAIQVSWPRLQTS